MQTVYYALNYEVLFTKHYFNHAFRIVCVRKKKKKVKTGKIKERKNALHALFVLRIFIIIFVLLPQE